MALKNATPIAAGIATDPAPKQRTGTCRPGAQRGEAERGPEHRQPCIGGAPARLVTD